MSCTAYRIITLLEASACLHRILQTAVIFILNLIFHFSFYTPLSLAYRTASLSRTDRPRTKLMQASPPPTTTNWHHLSKQAISTTATDDWYLPRVQESKPLLAQFRIKEAKISNLDTLSLASSMQISPGSQGPLHEASRKAFGGRDPSLARGSRKIR